MTSLSQRTREKAELELLYKQYARIAKSTDDLVHSSYNDFRLFGVVAGFLTWKPLLQLLDSKVADLPRVTFAGFVAFLLIFHVISFRDLMKQSMIYFR